MYNLVYVSDTGQRMVLNSFDHNVIVSKSQGLDGVNVEMYETQSARQDGTTIQKRKVQPQPIILSGEILGSTEHIRRQFYKTMIPKTSGYLFFNSNLKKRVEIETTPVVTRHAFNGFWQVAMYAPFPYWEESDEFIIDMVGMEAVFEFPINYDDPITHEFGRAVLSAFTEVENIGDMPAAFKIVFIAYGVVTNPSITKIPLNKPASTPETIAINRTMRAGERITLDTRQGVTITSEYGGVIEDIFGAYKLDSELFMLDPGENLLQFNADIGKDALFPYIIPQYTFTGAFDK